jgi:hypothetical protein
LSKVSSAAKVGELPANTQIFTERGAAIGAAHSPSTFVMGPIVSCEFAQRQPRPITALSFLAHEIQEQIDGFLFVLE